MISIHLYLKKHKRQERLFAAFEYNKTVNTIIKDVNGAKWSNSNKQWHFPLQKESVQKIIELTKEIATVDVSELRQQLNKRKQLKEESRFAGIEEPVRVEIFKTSAHRLTKAPATQSSTTALLKISASNREAMNKFLQTLQLKAYSTSTIKTYRNEFAQLLQTIGNHPVETLTVEQVKRYLQYCINKGCSENTIHSRLNALKFYYEEVLKREKMFFEIPRPKKPLLLPKVLSKEEIAAVIKAIDNLKHKTMIMLAYGCGLRVSEVTELQITDVDGQRRLLMIRRGKGKKDRVISLSPALLVMMREYYKA